MPFETPSQLLDAVQESAIEPKGDSFDLTSQVLKEIDSALAIPSFIVPIVNGSLEPKDVISDIKKRIRDCDLGHVAHHIGFLYLLMDCSISNQLNFERLNAFVTLLEQSLNDACNILAKRIHRDVFNSISDKSNFDSLLSESQLSAIFSFLGKLSAISDFSNSQVSKKVQRCLDLLEQKLEGVRENVFSEEVEAPAESVEQQKAVTTAVAPLPTDAEARGDAVEDGDKTEEAVAAVPRNPPSLVECYVMQGVSDHERKRFNTTLLDSAEYPQQTQEERKEKRKLSKKKRREMAVQARLEALRMAREALEAEERRLAEGGSSGAEVGEKRDHENDHDGDGEEREQKRRRLEEEEAQVRAEEQDHVHSEGEGGDSDISDDEEGGIGAEQNSASAPDSDAERVRKEYEMYYSNAYASYYQSAYQHYLKYFSGGAEGGTSAVTAPVLALTTALEHPRRAIFARGPCNVDIEYILTQCKRFVEPERTFIAQFKGDVVVVVTYTKSHAVLPTDSVQKFFYKKSPFEIHWRFDLIKEWCQDHLCLTNFHLNPLIAFVPHGDLPGIECILREKFGSILGLSGLPNSESSVESGFNSLAADMKIDWEASSGCFVRCMWRKDCTECHRKDISGPWGCFCQVLYTIEEQLTGQTISANGQFCLLDPPSTEPLKPLEIPEELTPRDAHVPKAPIVVPSQNPAMKKQKLSMMAEAMRAKTQGGASS